MGSSRRSRVGGRDEQGGEGDPAPLTAGEGTRRGGQAADGRGVDATEEAGEHVTDPRVGGPDVLRQLAEHRRPHRGERVELVVLGEHPAVSPPTRATLPESTGRSPARTRSDK